MFEDSSSVLCVVMRREKHVKLPQRKNPRWRPRIRKSPLPPTLDFLERPNHLQRLGVIHGHASSAKETGFTLLAL